MTFDAVGVFGLVFWLLFKSGSSYEHWYWGEIKQENRKQTFFKSKKKSMIKTYDGENYKWA